MSKRLIRSKIIIILSLFILVFAGSCRPVSGVKLVSSLSTSDTDNKAETRSSQSSTQTTTSTTGRSLKNRTSGLSSTVSTTSETITTGTVDTSVSGSPVASDDTIFENTNPDENSTDIGESTVTETHEEIPVAFSWTEVFEQISPSVALVRLVIPASTLYEKREETFSALIIDEEGLLISSYSMFDKAVDYRGVLMDGATVEVFVNDCIKPFTATMYGFDSMSDIVLLKIEANNEKLVAQPINTSEEVKVGLPIGVITSPEDYALEGSLVPGYVMSIQLPSVRENNLPYRLFVSDVPTLNKVPGAPLVDEYGQVLGICSASNQYSYLDYRTYVIPSSVIAEVTDYILTVVENATVFRPTLGIAVMSDDYADIFSQRNSYPNGLHVTSVQLGSPAYIAGLRSGDIILSINDNTVKLTRDLVEYMKEKSTGSYCEMRVFRPGEDKEYSFSCYLQQARH